MQKSTVRTNLPPDLYTDLLVAICDGVPYSIWAVDQDGRYIFANAQVGVETQREPSDLLGTTDADLYTPEVLQGIRERDASVLQSGVSRTDEVTANVGGTTKVYVTSRLPWRRPNGEIAGVIGILRDVTREREMERRLRQADRLEALGYLAGGIAHNLNNILAIIEMSCGALEQDGLSAAESTGIRAGIREATQRGARLAHQMLSVGRRQLARPTRVDVVAAVGSAVQRARGVIARDVQFDVSDADLHVTADREHLEQILVSLITHSTTESAEGPVVVRCELATLQEGGPGARITIRQVGKAMSPDAMERMFDPYRLDISDDLSLPAVFGLVQQSGWELSFGDGGGQGTTFEIRIPLAPAQPDVTRPSSSPTPMDPTGRVVVVAEDEPVIRRLLVKILNRAGHRVVSGGNAQEALRAIEESSARVSLLISDIKMPGVDGFALAREIRGRYGNIPVVYISGYSEHERMPEDVAGEFIGKPFSAATILEAVARLSVP